MSYDVCMCGLINSNVRSIDRPVAGHHYQKDTKQRTKRHKRHARVLLEAGVRGGLAAAALIEDDNAVHSRIEVTTEIGRGTAARPAVQKDDGLPAGVPRLLPVERVRWGDRQHARAVGLDRRVELPGAGVRARHHARLPLLSARWGWLRLLLLGRCHLALAPLRRGEE